MAKDPIKVDQPKAIKPNTGVDLNKIGKAPITTMRDDGMVKATGINQETGRQFTEFAAPGRSGERPVTVDTLQPFLTEKDVKKIGIYKWHEYKSNPEIFTTVVNGRRFKLTRPVFEGLKDKGLVIQDG